jgi:hypothetical protein
MHGTCLAQQRAHASAREGASYAEDTEVDECPLKETRSSLLEPVCSHNSSSYCAKTRQKSTQLAGSTEAAHRVSRGIRSNLIFVSHQPTS